VRSLETSLLLAGIAVSAALRALPRDGDVFGPDLDAMRVATRGALTSSVRAAAFGRLSPRGRALHWAVP
jgi:hypothetical protein